jgi:RNA recognition motif-containing protein
MGKRLYIQNLAETLGEADLRGAFADIGQVATVKVVLDASGRSRGFGFVEMATEEHALLAIQTLNGRELQGRALSVSEAHDHQRGGGTPRGDFGIFSGLGRRPGGKSGKRSRR